MLKFAFRYYFHSKENQYSIEYIKKKFLNTRITSL